MQTLPILFVLSCIIFSAAAAKPQRHAILVAASRSWLFYRHQATVMHAYQTLLANGFDKNNIITMIYDDLAINPKNTEKGVVRNHPSGDNLYPITKKDYTGSKVNAETFLAILAGDAATAKGPVLKRSFFLDTMLEGRNHCMQIHFRGRKPKGRSYIEENLKRAIEMIMEDKFFSRKNGPQDTVFIYFVGLGATQYMTFPTGPGITAQKFSDAIKKLRSNKKANKVMVLLETSFSASLVNGLLPRKNNIFVQTATHHRELPWAVYCDKVKRMCYGSLYGCGWTQHSDRLRQMKYGAKASIEDFYNDVRTATTFTHPNMYGHLEMGKEKISQFLDYKLVPKKQGPASSNIVVKLALNILNEEIDRIKDHEEDSDEPELSHRWSGLYDFLGFKDDKDDFSNSALDLNTTLSGLEATTFMLTSPEDDAEKETILENRKLVTDTMSKIFAQIKTNKVNEKAATLMKNAYTLDPLLDEKAEIYEGAINAFNEICFDMTENTYAQIEIGKLAALAAENITLTEQVEAMKSVCTSHHRMARSVPYFKANNVNKINCTYLIFQNDSK